MLGERWYYIWSTVDQFGQMMDYCLTYGAMPRLQGRFSGKRKKLRQRNPLGADCLQNPISRGTECFGHLLSLAK